MASTVAVQIKGFSSLLGGQERLNPFHKVATRKRSGDEFTCFAEPFWPTGTGGHKVRD